MAGKDCSSIELAFQMGEALLENGAEIFRAQETMEIVAASFNVDEFNTYVLTNGIFVNGVENGIEYRTKLKYIKTVKIHIGRISALNQLSREISENRYTIEEAFERIKQINELPYTKLSTAVLCCGLASASVCILFGGSLPDAAAASVCGFFLEYLLYIFDKYKASTYLTYLVSSGVVSLLGILLFIAGLGNDLDKVIIGAIIRLVPGYALTTSIRDFFNRDYLSGIIRMIEVLLLGGCMGLGIGAVIKIASMVLGGAFLI